MTHVTSLERTLDAPASVVFDTVLDIDSYPTWCPDVAYAHVLARRDDGSPTLARVRFDAPPLRDEMVFAYEVERGPSCGILRWRLQDAGVIRGLDGSYEISSITEDSCLVRYGLSVDLGLALHRMMREKIQARIAAAALDALASAAVARERRR